MPRQAGSAGGNGIATACFLDLVKEGVVLGSTDSGHFDGLLVVPEDGGAESLVGTSEALDLCLAFGHVGLPWGWWIVGIES